MATGIIQKIQNIIFSLAVENDMETASLCAKKFLFTFGLHRKIVRVDLFKLIVFVDFPRVY